MGNRVAVIDYGMGNLHSVAKALEHVGGDSVQVMVSHDADEILRADRVVLPGVGAMGDCMAEITRLGLDEVVRSVAQSKPLLGICVGMQALFEHSDESGGTRCLGLLPGAVHPFPTGTTDPRNGTRLKVPHMGWNRVRQTMRHPLWRGIEQESWFYFVHSYYVVPASDELTAATTSYPEPFTAAAARANIFAVQFHPEKSQQAGLALYANFLRWDGGS